jgi:hypothetical protein
VQNFTSTSLNDIPFFIFHFLVTKKDLNYLLQNLFHKRQ